MVEYPDTHEHVQGDEQVPEIYDKMRVRMAEIGVRFEIEKKNKEWKFKPTTFGIWAKPKINFNELTIAHGQGHISTKDLMQFFVDFGAPLCYFLEIWESEIYPDED